MWIWCFQRITVGVLWQKVPEWLRGSWGTKWYLEVLSLWDEGLWVNWDVRARPWTCWLVSAVLPSAVDLGAGSRVASLASQDSWSPWLLSSLQGKRHCELVSLTMPDILDFFEHCGAGGEVPSCLCQWAGLGGRATFWNHRIILVGRDPQDHSPTIIWI